MRTRNAFFSYKTIEKFCEEFRSCLSDKFLQINFSEVLTASLKYDLCLQHSFFNMSLPFSLPADNALLLLLL